MGGSHVNLLEPAIEFGSKAMDVFFCRLKD